MYDVVGFGILSSSDIVVALTYIQVFVENKMVGFRGHNYVNFPDSISLLCEVATKHSRVEKKVL